MRLTTSKAMRDADSRAIHVLGIPSTLLMTNAARYIAGEAIGILGGKRKAVCFCGSGNNGGDGLAAACCLMRRGVDSRCFLVGNKENMSEDCAEMERRFQELGGRLEVFDPITARQGLETAGVVIDAMFGIGLNGDLRETALEAVRLINTSGVPVVSADIASGVSADTGCILGDAVKATVTVTFSIAKIGHFAEPGCTCCGRLVIADIGIPAQLIEEAGTDVYAVAKEEVFLPKRSALTHKGDYGKLLIIGGSVGYTGAPVMCARAAARSGAGLIYVGVPRSIYEIAAAKLDEPMPFALDCDVSGKICSEALPSLQKRLDACNAAVIGCGLGRSEDLADTVKTLLRDSDKQLVIDADGLNALGSDAETIKAAKLPPILTPHEREFLTLGGTLTCDRVSDARSFAESRRCILVLKGHRTVCAFPGGEVYIIPYGNPGMAKGGSGDVLAGIIGAFVMQLSVKQAVVTACAVHALAGDLCAQRFGEYSMLPTDIIEALPEITKDMIQ